MNNQRNQEIKKSRNQKGAKDENKIVTSCIPKIN